ncbi:Uncharacterised protein [Moraxella caprae]|uniref:Uncharacterized protein n=1 Tax=Moraxella caprae TaxID=90240 RepID=A0A378R3W0_9GAMM|nr:hypothetical protein [Moraxella caprae]STZ08570.1 Uncharacterised protein [Moraxella caprae]
MTDTETQKPLILTVDEFLDADFSSEKLLGSALYLMYHEIPEIKQLIDSNADKLGNGYCFGDIHYFDSQLYERIRIQLSLASDKSVELTVFLTKPAE